MTGVTQLVFAATEEVDSGGCDNEGNAHSAAGGSGNNNGVTAGVWNEDIIVFVMDFAGVTETLPDEIRLIGIRATNEGLSCT